MLGLLVCLFLSVSINAFLLVFGPQRKFRCQKNKMPDKKNWPWPARISAVGGVPGRRCSRWATIHGCESRGLADITPAPMQLWLYLGGLSKSLAIELMHLLVNVYADRVPRERLEPSLPILPFYRPIDIQSQSFPSIATLFSDLFTFTRLFLQ